MSPLYDRALLSGIIAAKKTSSLVMAQTLDSSGRVRKLFAPIVSMSGEDSIGLSVIPVDPDGTVRRVDIAVQEQTATLYGRALGKLDAHVGGDYINFALGSPFDYIPMHDVIEPSDALRSRLAGKIVFVGAVLPFDDRHTVPVALAAFEPGNRVIPGVFVQAQALRGALNDAMIERFSTTADVALLLVVSLAWWYRYSLMSGALVAGGGLGALYGLGLYALAERHLYIPLGASAGVLLAAVFGRFTVEAAAAFRQRREYERSFARYVSPDVLSAILAGRIQPEMRPERRRVCVLFSDIRSFTARSEHQAPEVIIDFLNEYFEEMVAAVHTHGGTIDKFIGDGLMAFFGAPAARDDPAPAAFETAMEMLKRLERWNERLRARGFDPVEIGIGLHTGDVVIGHVGSTARHEYTVIGDTVNTASRLEGLAKTLKHPIICSDEVAGAIAPTSALTDLGEQPIRGRAPMHVFGWRSPVPESPSS